MMLPDLASVCRQGSVVVTGGGGGAINEISTTACDCGYTRFSGYVKKRQNRERRKVKVEWHYSNINWWQVG